MIGKVINLSRVYRDTEYMGIIEDLINRPMVQDLKLYPHHKHNNRFNHCLEVSYITYQLAKQLGWDEVSCARAGLLHDLFHYTPKTAKHFVSDHYLDHPKIAVMNARQITDLSSKEEWMILTHMWQPFGRLSDRELRPKSKEGWLLSVVDKYCASKDVSYYRLRKYVITASLAVEAYYKLKGRKQSK